MRGQAGPRGRTCVIEISVPQLRRDVCAPAAPDVLSASSATAPELHQAEPLPTPMKRTHP
eukprot:319020-Hanusia_phi.AAC.4